MYALLLMGCMRWTVIAFSDFAYRIIYIRLVRTCDPVRTLQAFITVYTALNCRSGSHILRRASEEIRHAPAPTIQFIA